MNNYNLAKLSALYASEIAQKQNFMIKIGTYVLTNTQNGNLNNAKIEEIVDQAADIYRRGRKVAIITSGAVAAGRAEAEKNEKARQYLASINEGLALRQALAAIGQPKLMEKYNEYMGKQGIVAAGQFLASYGDLADPTHKQNFVNTINSLYALGAIPILNENDPFSTDELETANGNGKISGSITFGDNDLLSVMTAQTLESQVLFLLSKEDGLMDFATHRKIDIIDDRYYAMQYLSDAKSAGGTGGMKSKLESIARATDSGIFVVLASGLEENIILRILQGEPLGTLFLPKNFKYTA